MTVIVFLIVLAVIIFVHEFGHFISAKIFKVRVDEFAIGFPPRIFSIKKGETVYSLNIIPFGGFVKIHGESAPAEGEEIDSRSLLAKPKIQQAIIMFAGVFLNFVFAWFLLSLSLSIGAPISEGQANVSFIENPEVTILSVMSDSPAEKAGILPGDKLMSLSSEEISLTENLTVGGVQEFISSHSGKVLEVTYKRGGETFETELVPTSGIVENRGAIGVSLDSIGIGRFSIPRAVWNGAVLTYEITFTTFKFTFDFIKNLFLPANVALDSVVGPVGLAGIVGNAYDLGIIYLLSLTAVISINLGVLNLIPMPALDGGRILFVIIEAIKGSPIRPHVANIMNGIGFSLLILLMLVITYKDLVKIFM